LIAGYLRPQSGTITIGKQSLADVSLKSYYQHVGYLTQEPLIFDGTIWENLTYALDTSLMSKKEIQKEVDTAIAHANCEFVQNFPQGLHTEIGER
jgi:ABC-type multidrug transport system fused ATPase/permease subunit